MSSGNGMELRAQLHELSLNLKWAQAVVKLLSKQTREREENLNTEYYLEKTSVANRHLSEFCTAMNRILDEDDDTTV